MQEWPSLPKTDLISCLICTSHRSEDLDFLLSDFLEQTLDKKHFEIIILNDGAGEDIRLIAEKYTNALPIRYLENKTPQKNIGLLRNKTILSSQGEYILFLDDDTRILQKNFLARALEIFKQPNPDVIIPLGKASYGIVRGRYDFFDAFSFGNAGVLYKREVLKKLRGFRNDLSSYEDIEFGIRLTICGYKIIKTNELVYLHPPFYFYSMYKPLSIGQSILKLRQHYSFLVWLLVYINALRFLPLCLWPTKRNLQWFKISLGVLLSPFVKKRYYY